MLNLGSRPETENLPTPSGFCRTGKHRKPKFGDWYLDKSGAPKVNLEDPLDFKAEILKPDP